MPSIDSIAASLQVVLPGLLNVFFYPDKRRITLWLCAALFGLNIMLTWVSLALRFAEFALSGITINKRRKHAEQTLLCKSNITISEDGRNLFVDPGNS
jgi:hypothetical protein